MKACFKGLKMQIKMTQKNLFIGINKLLHRLAPRST